MDDTTMHPTAILSRAALKDFRAVMSWSVKHFGLDAAMRYQALILQAMRDIQADPRRAGSRERNDIRRPGVRTYHIVYSRNRAGEAVVKEPRHLLAYRQHPDGTIQVSRILHDSRDLARHL